MNYPFNSYSQLNIRTSSETGTYLLRFGFSRLNLPPHQSQDHKAKTMLRRSQCGPEAIREEGGGFGGVFTKFDCDVLPVWLSACGVSFIFPQRCPPTDPTFQQHNTPTKVCSSCLLHHDPSVPVGQQQPLSFSITSLPPLSPGAPRESSSPAGCVITDVQYYCKSDTAARFTLNSATMHLF